MNRENCDINNVGQANIAKFRDSTFHDMETPLRLSNQSLQMC